MTPLDSQQRASIVKRLSFLEIELADLADYADLDEQTYRTDRKVCREVERLAENVVNAYVDVSKIVLAGEDLERPDR